MDSFVREVYRATKFFPREEIYGITSQLRRSALSVALNYIEGYARQRKAVLKNFLETSYGSLKESAYLLEISFDQKYLSEKDYKKLSVVANEIGAMIYGILKKI